MRGEGRRTSQVLLLAPNLLLYLHDPPSSRHKRALNWLESTFSGTAPVGLPWQTITAFLRITTNPNLPGDRFTAEEATQIVGRWLEQPNIRLLAPGDNHWSYLRQMIVDGQG